MKLSTLVNYRNLLDELTLDSLRYNANYDLKKITHLVESQVSVNPDINQQLQTQEQTIYKSIDDFQTIVDSLRRELDQQINNMGQQYFVDSYKLYENAMLNETLADVKNRHPNIPDATVDFYCSRIKRYSGWQHPAMIVRPGIEPYFSHMVSCDPLYLVDLKHEMLDPAMSQYNELYQRRLRPYVVNEQGPDKILSRLPDSQFGVILVYNFFNFRPFEVIRTWLAELLDKLKPGGVLIMTINDCDRDKAVMLTEHAYCCYTPGVLVKQLALTLGFELEFEWHDGGPSTWLELRKPGQLTTLRGGQTLAKILPKPIAQSK